MGMGASLKQWIWNINVSGYSVLDSDSEGSVEESTDESYGLKMQ